MTSIGTIAASSHRATDVAAEALLRQLVSIPSLSMNERACVEALVGSMRELGFEAFIDASGSAVGVVGDPSADAKEIVLLGHIDTVPGIVPIRQEGDLLFGRGTVDAKGPLAAFVIAAARATLPANTRVRVIGAVEEEAATSKGARFATTAYRADACIIGEPSGAEGITLGYKGRLIAHATITTNSSHSAGPEPTAPELAFEVWSRIQQACDELRPVNAAPRVFDRVQARLRTIQSKSDGLHDIATMTLGFRLPPGISPQQIQAICTTAAQEADAPIELTFSGHEVAHVAERSNPVARAFSVAIRAEGGMPSPKLKTGTSDMNVVGPIWNCPIGAYGPGDSSLDHTPNEHISLSEYQTSIRTLQRAIESLAAELAM